MEPIEAARAPSTIEDLALTGLHRGLGPRHWVNRGRQREKKKMNPCITVVTGLVQASLTRQTTRISIGPRGRPQAPQAPRTTMPPTSPIPSIITPPPLPLPSMEVGPSGFGTPQDLKSMCGNRVLCRFAHFAAPISKGQAPGSQDSMAGPSR
jgi:hypothetical protein